MTILNKTESLGFYILPLDQSNKWKLLIDAKSPADFQQQLARRYFDEEAYVTVYAGCQSWVSIKELDGNPNALLTLTKSMIKRAEAKRIWNLASRNIHLVA